MMQPSTPTPGARCFSLLEFAVAAFIVVGHNVFHILPNEVPILFVLGWISQRSVKSSPIAAIYSLAEPKC